MEKKQEKTISTNNEAGTKEAIILLLDQATPEQLQTVLSFTRAFIKAE